MTKEELDKHVTMAILSGKPLEVQLICRGTKQSYGKRYIERMSIKNDTISWFIRYIHPVPLPSGQNSALMRVETIEANHEDVSIYKTLKRFRLEIVTEEDDD